MDETFTNNYVNLFDTINAIYKEKTPVSRILYLAKIKETTDKDERLQREAIIGNFTNEVMKMFKRIDSKFYHMIVYIGTSYALLLIEVCLYVIITNLEFK